MIASSGNDAEAVTYSVKAVGGGMSVWTSG